MLSKINNTLIDNAEDLDIVMPMYDLLEYSHNYSMTSRSLWNHSRDKIDDVDVNDSALDSKSFKYKTKIVEETPRIPLQPGNTEGAYRPPVTIEVTILLKYLINFWRSLDLPLINCKVKLDLSWTNIMIEHHNKITGVNFTITSTKHFVPVVTLSINNKI